MVNRWPVSYPAHQAPVNISASDIYLFSRPCSLLPSVLFFFFLSFFFFFLCILCFIFFVFSLPLRWQEAVGLVIIKTPSMFGCGWERVCRCLILIISATGLVNSFRWIVCPFVRVLTSTFFSLFSLSLFLISWYIFPSTGNAEQTSAVDECWLTYWWIHLNLWNTIKAIYPVVSHRI